MGIVWGVAGTYWQLGTAAYNNKEYELARSMFEQGLEIARKENYKSAMVFGLNSLGELARLRNDYASAKAIYAETVQIGREIGHQGNLASYLLNLGQTALHDHDATNAKIFFQESLEIYRELERPRGLAGVLIGFAGVLGVAGNFEKSARLFGAAEQARQVVGEKLDPPDEIEYNRIIAMVRAQLDDTTFNAAWVEGQAMTLEQTIELALNDVASV